MHPFITIGHFKILTFSLIVLLDIFVCLGILAYNLKFNMDKFDEIRRVIIQAFMGVIVGGRGLSALTLSGGNFKSFFYYIIYGGTVFFGGFCGGMVAIYIFCKRNDISFWYISDNILRILPFGQAIGRIACYFNGCCYGKQTNCLIAVNYIVNGIKTRVYPTWFIEMFGCFVIFLILQKPKYDYIDGKITFLYLILYSSLRFAIEFLRGDEIRGLYFGLSTSQIISIIILLLAIIMKRRQSL